MEDRDRRPDVSDDSKPEEPDEAKAKVEDDGSITLEVHDSTLGADSDFAHEE